MPKKIIAGNWKMYKTNPQALRLVAQIKSRLAKKPVKKCEVIICPPYTALYQISRELKASRIGLGAQNLYEANEGAYTGEISAPMIRSCGAQWVIIGHSERRQYFREDERIVNGKIKIALQNKLKVILCVGETLEMRQQNLTKDIVLNQVEWGLKDLTAADLKNVVLAYEPVWAIGTGKTATPQQAQEIHAFLREVVDTLFEGPYAKNLTILYGGSVKPENAEGLFSQPDIDGALVGGACLDAGSFYQIIRAAEKAF